MRRPGGRQTMYLFDGIRSAHGGHPGVLLTRSWAVDARTVAVADPSIDVAHWSKTYRDGLPWAGITFPARALGLSGVAAAVKKAGHCVDVHSADELTLAVAV